LKKVVDARGLPCPKPVVLAKRALEESAEVEVLVDSEVALSNLRRMALSMGASFEVVQGEGHAVVRLSRADACPASPAFGGKVLLVTSDSIGRGSDELGSVLMRTFFYALLEARPLPSKVIFVNFGVKLTTHEGQVLEHLRELERRGVEIISCGTCLDYLGLRDSLKVGSVGDMFSIAQALMEGEALVL